MVGLDLTRAVDITVVGLDLTRADLNPSSPSKVNYALNFICFQS